MATGPYHWLKLHETHMQGQSFFINGVTPNGKKFDQEMKGILEPVMLYRFIVPKEAMPLVVNTLGDGKADKPNGLNLQAWALRKALNLDKIPDYPKTDVKMPISKDYMQIVPIGIKEDPERIMGATGVKQEAL